MTDIKDRPNTEERYSSATHASNLAMMTERSGPVDMLVAAGWSPSRLGAALMRLLSEWDGAAKPQPIPPRVVEAMAEQLGREAGRQKADATDHRAAREQAGAWLMHENKILLGKLKTLAEVREQMRLRAEHQGLTDPMGKAMAALLWWLDKSCHACNGRKWEAIEGTPKLSERACPVCKATGERPQPNGFETMALIGYMDDCVSAARVSMRKRLRLYSPHR